MKDDRLRVTFDAPYAHALGLAAFCWARCEWDAVWSCERLKPGYVGTIEAEKKTAGQIAKDLIAMIQNLADPQMRAICMGPAKEFKRLVDERNGLVHGKPGTAENGDQRLFRHGAVMTIETVNDLSDEFTACQLQLNDMVHKYLLNN
jgi:hypothetical protein